MSLFYLVSRIGQFVTLSSQKHAPEQWDLTYFPQKTALGLPCSKSALYAGAPATSCQPVFAGKSSVMEEVMSRTKMSNLYGNGIRATNGRSNRYPSIVSTGRAIRVFGDTAVVHGSESDEVEADGKRFSVRYMYLDVLQKRDGQWRLVASQLSRPMEE